jgi:hypothetical protein
MRVFGINRVTFRNLNLRDKFSIIFKTLLKPLSRYKATNKILIAIIVGMMIRKGELKC